jgi:hypothetical protein
MLFKLLKLFGLDLAGEIAAAKASLEQHAESAADRIKRFAEGTAVIAALGIFASITATMALSVGLIALYRVVAGTYGDYAGLGAVAAVLIAMTATLAAVIFAQAQKLSSAATAPRATGAAVSGTAVSSEISRSSASSSEEQPVAMPATSTDDLFLPSRAPAAPRDLIDPLALVLSDIIEVPKFGNPVVDDLVGKIRTTAHGSVDEAVYGAATTIRYGRPADLILVLVGTAALAWLVTRNARLRR